MVSSPQVCVKQAPAILFPDLVDPAIDRDTGIINPRIKRARPLP